MEEEIFHQMALYEDQHWWFQGRRNIVAHIIDGLALPEKARILEVGCGTGGNLALLARYGAVVGVEMDDLARNYAQKRNLAPILPGGLPDDLPELGPAFDLIVMTDVLEHIEADDLSLQQLRGRLKPGGHLLITVPACPALWSKHDDLHHHKRRYSRADLSALVAKSGYIVVFVSYINMLLFPMIAGIRLIKRSLKIAGTHDLAKPPKLINKLLAGIFSSEIFFLDKLSLPFGVSLLLLARRDD